MNITERFLKYVGYGTNSDEKSETCPSTPNQLVLGAAIAEELKALGVQQKEDIKQLENVDRIIARKYADRSNGKYTADSIEDIIHNIQKQECNICTVSDLLGLQNSTKVN